MSGIRESKSGPVASGPSRFVAAWSALLLALFPAFAAAEKRPADQPMFERDVRPILKEHCFHCHGEGDEHEGGLDVRLRRFLVKGGESGAAISLDDPVASLLLQRVRDGEMPPEEKESRPTKDQVALIARWIESGAPTIEDEPETIEAGSYFTAEERNYWAFQPIRRPPLPSVSSMARIRTPIDQFILARLEREGLAFSDEAEQSVLLRRACFDLTGLPPTPELTSRFLADESPDAYERLVDELLASPRYGERWGRHWLDVAGYADSEGYTDADAIRPDAWKYRDYVIRSMNDDKPFDSFVREQLAGDEMVSRPFEQLPPGDVEKLIATGFLRMAPDGTGSGAADQGVARNEVIAKTIEIVSTSLLGMTVGCAQCHNHRYDPISQEDYYRFRAIFDPAYNWQQWQVPSKRRVSLYGAADKARAAAIENDAKKIDAERKQKEAEYIQNVLERELAKLPSELHAPIREARDTAEKKRTAAQKKLLMDYPSVNVSAGSLYLYDRKAADDLKAMAAKATKIRATKPKQEFVRALFEPENTAPPESFLFSRGDHEQPKQKVLPGELAIVTSTREYAAPVNDESLATTGRRLSYANWLTGGEHPLVARVLVNRIWMNHFGRGIVDTPGDFGYLGVRPSHPELLDWLASEFADPQSGQPWSLKRLHKLILMSTVYRQSSRRTAKQDAIDADNRFYARMSVRRLDAEQIRDSTLVLSGRLNLKMDGPPVPVMADRVGRFVIGKENLNAGRPGPVIPMKGEEFRRSIFVQVRRSRPLGVLDPFDPPRMEPNCTSRNSSTVAPQSLMLMNSDFVTTLAIDVARQVQQISAEEVEDRVVAAWQLVLAKQPTSEQISDAAVFIREQQAFFEANKQPKEKAKDALAPELEALASFCHALLSSNEFLYTE